jgi:pimeloyl-ACP methyl ester carboxylesterase
MAGLPSALTAGATSALDLAQADAAARAVGAAGAARRVVADEPVLLVGHSLGGIAASALASSPAFTARHRVTHVVTFGSPVSRADVGPQVEVLSLEHHQDPVPRLDGRPDPDRLHWVTVTRDLADDPGARTAAAAHDAREYVETAELVDASADPSVVRWRETARPFFAADGAGAPVIRDYRVERVGSPVAAPGVAQSEP